MTQLLEAVNANSISINQDNIKKFANRLKKSLEKDSIKFKTSKCYDILAQTLGSSNWHELSQQLSAAPINKESNLSLSPAKNEKKLKSIFDYSWPEFKYFISKICEHMGYGERIKIFTLSLLEVIKDRNKQGSHLLWDKISIILSQNKFNLIRWANNDINLDHYLDLNPDLEENIKTKINTDLWPFFSIFSPDVEKKDDPAITIMKIFKLINYLHNENILLWDQYSQLKSNDITNNLINYPIIHDLLSYINNKKIKETLSLHEVIFNLYCLSIDSNDYYSELMIKAKNIVIKSLLNDLDFCSYVIPYIKERVYNKYYLEQQNNLVKIHLDLNYVDNYEIGNYIYNIIDNNTISLMSIEVYIKINKASSNIRETDEKALLDHLKNENYLLKVLNKNQTKISYFI